MYKMIRNFIFLLISLALVFVWFSNDQPVSNKQATATLSGNITNEGSAQICLDLLKKNLTAATEKKFEIYLATLSEKTQEATKTELSSVYDSYDLVHELIAFKVLKQKPDSLFAEAFQWTSNVRNARYQNHIAQIHYTFMIEAGEWKITDAVITNIEQVN